MKSLNQTSTTYGATVAPFTGAWIEIGVGKTTWVMDHLSLPSRERGLKSLVYQTLFFSRYVAPFTGAWIEITKEQAQTLLRESRSLHGSVD